jgi:hypothetical protein
VTASGRFRLARDSRPHYSRSATSLRHVLILLVLTCIVGLAPLAYADPPDPAWIPGIWDDDDQDDAILQATLGYHGISVGRP